MSNELTEAYGHYIREVAAFAERGDHFAIRTLCVINLLLDGWRPGPRGGPSGGGEGVIDFQAYRQRIAA